MSPQTQQMLIDSAEMFVQLFLELTVLFLVISFAVGLINQKLPADKIQRLLGARKGRGYLMAAGLGAVTPFCSCSTIPMLIGLLKARAGFGPTMTFLFTSPLLNPIVIALFIPVLGLNVTLWYAGTRFNGLYHRRRIAAAFWFRALSQTGDADQQTIRLQHWLRH